MLQPGDILMWRVDPGAPLLDRLIGWGERMLKQSDSAKKNYYHVGFVGPNYRNVYQSKPPAICCTEIPQPLPDNIEVYRLIVPPTPDQLKSIFTYANSQLGKWYNFLGVLTGGYVQIGSFQFCSQFTWIAYSAAGIQLCPFEFLESPDDIAASDKLTKIT